MKRRAFVAGMAAVMAALIAAEAQHTGKLYRIAALHVGLDHVPPSLAAVAAVTRIT